MRVEYQAGPETEHPHLRPTVRLVLEHGDMVRLYSGTSLKAEAEIGLARVTFVVEKPPHLTLDERDCPDCPEQPADPDEHHGECPRVGTCGQFTPAPGHGWIPLELCHPDPFYAPQGWGVSVWLDHLRTAHPGWKSLALERAEARGPASGKGGSVEWERH